MNRQIPGPPKPNPATPIVSTSLDADLKIRENAHRTPNHKRAIMHNNRPYLWLLRYPSRKAGGRGSIVWVKAITLSKSGAGGVKLKGDSAERRTGCGNAAD